MLIARTLGVDNYGAFVAALALVGIIAPFATVGSGNLLIKYVALDREQFAIRWGNALLLTFLSSSLLLVLLGVGAWIVLPASLPLSTVLFIGAADIIWYRLVDVSGQAFQSVERLDWTALLYVGTSIARLSGALLLAVCVRHPTVESWSLLYMAVTAVAGVAAACLACRLISCPRVAGLPQKTDIREGAYFSVSLSAQSVYNDVDKAMLARFATLAATGIYGAAYRVIDVSFSPVAAVLSATYVNFFRHGASGIAGSGRFVRQILPASCAYGLAVWIVLVGLSPSIPHILGREYGDVAEAVRWLAPIPLLRCLHYFLADALTGAGYQGLRSAAQLTTGACNILLNLWLLPRYGWQGAAWASLACDGILLVSVGAAFWYLSTRAENIIAPIAA